ncbi:SusC/RagA family TonB-linked outer membrane protein [Parabacteroides distasonis]|uniref:SusC/RagA family TonB-linked outer membrane protein n=1 Tax=Parabacteroides distasonis TaxID=823 RepID=UPI001FB9FCC3|nr:SusC/RagA family TonB-linked outer membrane protein [Parabacteroides distasonis]GKH90581.1 SusC/RagA family TonB-linked outer membrane protein [Parabacteroides distasonis]
MRKSFILLLAFFLCVTGYAQKLTISGVVIDKDLNEPLTGVNVLVKGTTTGTITDFDGKYTLEADANSILVFSYLSMKTIEEPVNGRTKIDVTMVSDAEALDEVVVTAMGIKRESKTLTYSAQTVGGKDLNEIKNVNMINSLQGKSAGLQITPNSTGAGGSSKILFRGNKSISGSNQPLIVVDGVPMMMSVSDSQVKMAYGGERDGGDAMSTINPDDIAQITLLKGASAAALYGAVAANGAIMITTKSAQAGKVAINVSSNTTVESAMSLPKFQNNYGMSDEGTFSWGSKLGATSPNYARKFYQPGYTTNNSISLSGGTENISSYFSYANVSSNGIMPENDYLSHNLMAKVGFNLWKKVHVDVSARYNKQHIENQPSAGYLNNPITGAYLFPRGEDWDYYKSNYEVYDGVRNVNVHNWTNTKQEQFSNPYWMLNRQTPITDRNRYEFGGSVKYDIMEGLSVTGRLRYERGDEKWILNEYASSTAGRNLLGTMKDTRTFSEQTYADALASYNKTWDETYSLSVTAGGSFTKTSASSIELIGWGDKEFKVNNGVITPGAYYPNIFSPKNYYTMQTTETLKEKRLNSVFATAQFGYKEGLFLDVSARNDWSSSLAFTDGVSFFYPSVGVSALLDKFLDFGKNVDLFKLRASYSIVGNDVPIYASNKRYTIGDQGSIDPPEEAAFRTLKPEKTNSLEVGFDGTFFQNRFNVNLTYYKTNTKNQYFNITAPWETGLKNRYINAGNVENQGFEVSLGWYNQFTDNFSWSTNFNFSYNNNKIIELSNELKDWTLASYCTGAKVILTEGGHFGDLYVRDFKRDDNGKPVKTESGAPELGGTDNKDLVYVGDMNAKVNMGWTNTFHYKDFTLSFLIDAKVLSMTEATLDGWGVSERSGAARDAGEVVIDGVSFDPKAYYTTTGGTSYNSNILTSQYVYNATNVRLRELSFGYTFRNLFGANKNLTASIIGRNLFFFYKDAPMDPDVAAGTGNGWQGVDMFALPTSRSFGLNLKLNF